MWLLKMEKSSQPYHFPGSMLKLLRRNAMNSIQNDYNMIIEEGGFWEMLSTNYQTMVVTELFSDVRDELS